MTGNTLKAALSDIGPAAIAVSGGIDSLTLATFAVKSMPGSTIFHAVSPAVPASATRRVRQLAKAQNWALTIFNAGEFHDPAYLANPVNRCFFCKGNLYGAIAAHTDMPILSGTNLDDLDDYRPGLQAATQHGVRHPFVEAGIDKAGIRRLARRIGLGDLSDLPASPCLSSRVTTGLRIEPGQLAAIERTEEALRARFAARALRCRLTQEGFQVEIDGETLSGLDADALVNDARAVLGPDTPVLAPRPYLRGSAFVGDKP